MEFVEVINDPADAYEIAKNMLLKNASVLFLVSANVAGNKSTDAVIFPIKLTI